MRSTHFFSLRAVSYFCQSFSPCGFSTRTSEGSAAAMALHWKRARHLYPGAGVQHDVLDGALDVLRPRHQPRYFVVMANFFPLGSRRRFRVLGVPSRSRFIIRILNILERKKNKKKKNNPPAAVDDNVLGSDAPFQHAHLRVVSSATEQSRGLDAEVCDALLVVVHDAETKLLQDALTLFFCFLERRRNKSD